LTINVEKSTFVAGLASPAITGRGLSRAVELDPIINTTALRQIASESSPQLQTGLLPPISLSQSPLAKLSPDADADMPSRLSEKGLDAPLVSQMLICDRIRKVHAHFADIPAQERAALFEVAHRVDK